MNFEQRSFGKVKSERKSQLWGRLKEYQIGISNRIEHEKNFIRTIDAEFSPGRIPLKDKNKWQRHGWNKLEFRFSVSATSTNEVSNLN